MFQVFLRYVASVVYRCCKSRSDVTHVVWLYTYVSSVCSKSFICSRRTLQVFYLDIAKVDLDVAYTCMLQANIFKYFSGVSYVCLQVFHLDFAYVCNVVQAFSQVF